MTCPIRAAGRHRTSAMTPQPDTNQTLTARRSRRRSVVLALLGVLSGALGLATTELLAGLRRTWRNPIFDVGDRVVERSPQALTKLAIEWFGTNDKVVLLGGIIVVLGLLSAWFGVLAARGRRKIVLAAIVIIGALGALAASAPTPAISGWEPLQTVPSALGTIVAIAAFVWLTDAERAALSTRAATAATPSRRDFVLRSTGVALGAGIVAATGRGLARRFEVASSRDAITLPTPMTPAPDPGTAIQAPNAAPFFTTNRDFYRIDTALTIPQIAPDDWTLRLTGMVERDIELTYADLVDRPIEEHDITLTCVSNVVGGDLIGTARWLGIRLDDLLESAGVDPEADQIVGRSIDGYTCGFPVEALDGRAALVAIGMNGEPLPLRHGFPARLIVPGIYGYASATKWLTEIELTRFDRFDHYWVPRGYAAQAPIKLQSRIDTPRGLDRIAAGPFVIGGVAWHQPIGIDAVEVRIDGDDWIAATLADELDESTWRQWSLPWDATPGRHTIEARAISRNGAIQTEDRSEPLPDGATGHHTVVVLVDEA